jgi:hypothetical protein
LKDFWNGRIYRNAHKDYDEYELQKTKIQSPPKKPGILLFLVYFCGRFFGHH